MPVLSFKVTPEQAREMRRAARLNRKTLSAYLRDSALPSKQPPPAVKMKRHPVSGVYYNAAPGQRAPSLAEIDAALAEFP